MIWLLFLILGLGRREKSVLAQGERLSGRHGVHVFSIVEVEGSFEKLERLLSAAS
jgi:hypothetical protein